MRLLRRRAPAAPDLSALIELFIVSRQAANASPSTIANYHNQLRPFAAFITATGHDWTRPESLDLYLATTRQRGLSSASTHTAYRRLSTFTKWAQSRGHIPHNPALQVTEPKLAARGPKAVGHANALAMIAAAARSLKTRHGWRNLALITTIYGTGLRATEAAHLRITDLDLTQRTLYIHAGKGDKDRIVVFAHPVAATLGAYLAVRNREQPYLFPGQRGPLTKCGVEHAFDVLAHAAGITSIHNPHAFRHEYARQYLLRGGSLRELSQQLGHASIETTAHVYALYLLPERRHDHDKASPLTDPELTAILHLTH